MSDSTNEAGSEFVPKAGTLKIGGLGRKAQKLQALKEKAAQQKSGVKSSPREAGGSLKVKDTFAGSKKTNFQRKSV